MLWLDIIGNIIYSIRSTELNWVLFTLRFFNNLLFIYNNINESEKLKEDTYYSIGEIQPQPRALKKCFLVKTKPRFEQLRRWKDSSLSLEFYNNYLSFIYINGSNPVTNMSWWNSIFKIKKVLILLERACQYISDLKELY